MRLAESNNPLKRKLPVALVALRWLPLTQVVPWWVIAVSGHSRLHVRWVPFFRREGVLAPYAR